MIVLDTNVISALMHQQADTKIVAWLDSQPASSIWTTSLTVLEVRFGLEVMSSGKRRTVLMEAFENLLEQMGQRVAAFDTTAARHAADLMASRKRRGRPGELRDTMIAGIVLAHRATLATRNVSHFEDLSVAVVNPWTA